MGVFSRWSIALVVLLALGLAGVSAADAAGNVTNCSTFGSSETVGILSQDTILDGTGQSVTLSGNNANRVLSVNFGVTAGLKIITVANGSGGGIFNLGTLTLTLVNSTVSGNSAHDGGGDDVVAVKAATIRPRLRR